MRVASILPLAFVVVLASACQTDDAEALLPPPTVTVPATYDFANVSYTGQQERLAMLSEMKAAMQAAATGTGTVSAERLRAMYANEDGAGFERAYGKDIRSKTFQPVRADFEDYIVTFAELATEAPSTAASPGVAGRLSSGEKIYLFDERGVEWLQVIEKGLMGATFYYQATSVYLGSDKMSADNETVEPGVGTAMEHHWDEAFGYLGVPRDYPSNRDDLQFWGSYTDKRAAALGTDTLLMAALRKGRAAISAEAYEVRDEAISEVRDAWELVSAATAIHYLNSAVEKGDDLGARLHALTEAVAFAYALQFNEATRLDREDYRTWLKSLAGGDEFDSINLHDVTDADVAAARETLALRYPSIEQPNRL